MTTHSHRLNSFDRTIFLGDIENLAYNQQLGGLLPEDVQWASAAVWSAIRHFSPQEVIASSHYFAKNIWFSWGRNPRRLVASGPNGADHKLLEVIYNEDLHTRYDTVIIGSGDAIFAHPAAHLIAQGLNVIAIHGTGGASKKLQLAVHDTIQLPTPSTGISAA